MMNNDQWVRRILDAIINHSRDHLIVTDGEGFIRFIGDSCKEIYGMDKRELLGKNVITLEKDKIFFPSATRKVIEEKTPQTIMQETHKGQKLMVFAFPVWSDTGELSAIVSYSHDITEILELKRQYEKLSAQLKQFENEIEELREKNMMSGSFVAVSEEMREIKRLINKVAKVDSTVLLLGESGVGKNVIAKEIHRNSRRASGQFVEINCGAIPEGLLESELFGYEAGAFTGAGRSGKKGIIELADQGTLFLDELGELPLSLQAKLLQVIQEKRVQRIGSTVYRDVDFRLIAATNRDLERMVKEGKFRQDLYYRLNVVPIRVPPLRNRPEDTAALLRMIIRSLNDRYGMNKQLDAMAVEALLHYDWPGNVRELENVLERVVVTTDDDLITVDHLPEEIRFHRKQFPQVEMAKTPISLKKVLEQTEEKWLRYAAERCQTTMEMAVQLGISQPSVVRKLKKYKIKRIQS